MNRSFEDRSIGLEVSTHARDNRVDRVIVYDLRQIRHRLGRIVQSMNHQRRERRRQRSFKASPLYQEAASMRFRNTQPLVSRKPQFNPCSKIFVELSLAVQSKIYRL